MFTPKHEKHHKIMILICVVKHIKISIVGAVFIFLGRAVGFVA